MLNKNITIKKLKKVLLIAVLTITATIFVSQIASAQGSLCLELAGDGGFFDCAGQGEITFTQFEGGFDAPSTEGYSPGLTEQTNLRDFVLNAVNFVLGFLGLVAVIIIIYGGVLMVTSRGEDDPITKGKKSITYAIIGIVIILVSFALVNTVIKGIGRGTDIGGGSGTLQQSASTEFSEDQKVAMNRLFKYAASRVETIARDFVTSYENFSDVYDVILEIEAVPAMKDYSDLNNRISTLENIFRNIENTSGGLSNLNEGAKDALFLAREWELDVSDARTDEIEWEEFSLDFETQFRIDLDTIVSGFSPQMGLVAANETDFRNSIDSQLKALETLKADIEASGLLIASGSELDVAYNNTHSALEGIKTLIEPDNQAVKKVLDALGEFHAVVLNIQFVGAVITVDVKEGNAPTIVNFDALKSLRPDFTTIADTDISWDFGDGQTAEGSYAVSHVYKKPGGYVAKLTIEGDPDNNIANGVAYQTITVNPPASQINLRLFLENRDLGYMSLYKDGFLVIDKDRLNVTLTESRDIGLTFDASESLGGFEGTIGYQAGETYIQAIKWTFGDGTDAVMGEMVAESIQTHYYGEEGRYPVVIEVTDSRGMVDRKIFEVIVGSPAARMNISPSAKEKINTQITFDGTPSNSDAGQIVDYSWNWDNPILHYSDQDSGELIARSFVDPGLYNVQLKVIDNLGEEATDNAELMVESKPPQAQFSYEVISSSKPNVYKLDGSRSFDPDGNIFDAHYNYKWTILGAPDAYEFVDENGSVDSNGSTKLKTFLKFKDTGEYTVQLDIDDTNESENPGIIAESTIIVDSILDIAFGNVENTSAAILDEEGKAEITFMGLSENGVEAEWDFGDGEEPVLSTIINGKTEVKHNYFASGKYDLRLTVFDEEDDENSVTRRIVIGDGETPIPVIAIFVNGEEVYDFSQAIAINRKTVVTLDASRSLNIDGTGRRLGYSWDFGDTQKSTKEIVTHTYSDLSPTDPGYYVATLKVMDQNDVTKSATSEVQMNVIGELPTMQAFTAVPQQSDLTTPVKVKLEAIGAEDPDGQIVKYLWWYYDSLDPELTFGQTITQNPTAIVTIGTRGVEGEEVAYKFGLKMTDQENFDISADEILSDNMIPSLAVTNGPNDIPVARFNVDRTNINVGEMVNFTSSSYDPDGKITQYIWDFEGDGFGNNKSTDKSQVAYTFENPSPDGLNIRLKVIDNNFAESVSPPIIVYVDALASDPIAAFKTEVDGNSVKFVNNSTVDEASGAELVSYSWDFDLSSSQETADSDGDGEKGNDVDSIEIEPEFEYLTSGIYRAKLTIVDSFENSSEVTNFVFIKDGEEEATVITPGVLKADFVSSPTINPLMETIYLSGQFADVSFDFRNSKGKIVKYVFDNNIYVDSDNNGRKADDKDYTTLTPGVYTTTYNQETDKIKLRLTVYDEEGNFDIKEIKIEFDNISNMSANIFNTVTPSNLLAVLVSAWLLGVLYLVISRRKFNKEKANRK